MNTSILRQLGNRALIVASLLLTTHAYGQATRSDVFADDPRPLEAAVLSLIGRYPVMITYEDPPYAFSADVKDVTDIVRKSPSTRKDRILVPQGHALQASFDVSAATGQPTNLAEALDTLVDAKNANPIGGRFGVVRNGNLFHIVPIEVRDRDGRWIKAGSILDTPITLSTETLNGYALIESILKRVSAASGTDIGLSAERFANAFARYSGKVEAQNEPARDILLRTLRGVSTRFTWMLNYDPSGRYYVFAVELAAEPPPAEVPLNLAILPRLGGDTPAGGRQQR